MAIAGLTCLGVIVVFLGLGYVHLTGERVLVMDTGSMSPVIRPGDIVVLKPEPVNAVRPGDVISFNRPTSVGGAVTHRVVKVDAGPDGIGFHTKGDRNNSEDGWIIQYHGVAWKEVHVLPKMGRILAWAKRPAGQLALGMFIFATSLILFLPSTRPTNDASPALGLVQ